MAGRGGLINPSLILVKDPFGTELKRRLETFRNEVERSAIDGAHAATSVSRGIAAAKESGRPFVDARPMRSTTYGRFPEAISWNAHRDNSGEMVVDLDIAKLEAATPTHYGGPGYWLIQEIGTGKSAYIGGHAPWERRVSIKSQMGRVIPFGLVWADSGGTFQAASQSRYGQDQLIAAARFTQLPSRASAGVIGREIEGKHFLRDGGLAGYTQFRSNALAAAKQAFAGRRKR